MAALTTEDYKKAVNKYLLTYDLENWKIFVDNYYKLTPYEIELIINELAGKADFHMIIDILSLSGIIGQSIALSNTIVKMLSKIDITQHKEIITKKIDHLLESPFAEERRIGLFVAGYFNLDEYFDVIERMSNYDIIFEDAYFSLGLMTNPEIIEKLGIKFMQLGANQIQRNAIAKILAQKGNPLAALWLFKNKEFDFTTPYTKSIYLAREWGGAGIKPALLLDSDDDFLQPITLKFIDGISSILHYDIDLITEINIQKTAKKLIHLLEKEPDIDTIKTTFILKNAISDIYQYTDPYSVDKELREEITGAWKILDKFPKLDTINFIRIFIRNNLDVDSERFLLAIKLIRNFRLKEFEQEIIAVGLENSLTLEQEIEIISCLGQIGSEISAEYIINNLPTRIDINKRIIDQVDNSNIDSDIDLIDELDDDLLINLNQSFDENIIELLNIDLEELYYLVAIYALGSLKSNKAFSILGEALNDYNPRVRFQAISALKNIRSINPLLEDKLVSLALHDPYMSIQREAYITLGVLSSDAAIPLFIKTIFQAIEDGTVEMINEIIDEYDNRWEIDDVSEPSEELATKDKQEIGATPNISREKIPDVEKKSYDNEISRWINRLNYRHNKTLELREDLIEYQEDLAGQDDYFDGSEISDIYDPKEYFPDGPNTPEDIEDDDLLSEIGEQFRKITIVESVIEALKSTNGKLPVNDLKEIIAHPVDDEIYKDILIILARSGEVFAIKELTGLFNPIDFIRAREIVDILSQKAPREFNDIKLKIKQSPDWILNDKVPN